MRSPLVLAALAVLLVPALAAAHVAPGRPCFYGTAAKEDGAFTRSFELCRDEGRTRGSLVVWTTATNEFDGSLDLTLDPAWLVAAVEPAYTSGVEDWRTSHGRFTAVAAGDLAKCMSVPAVGGGRLAAWELRAQWRWTPC